MRKRAAALCWIPLLIVLLAACAGSDAFEPSEADKLRDRERFALYDYARSALFSSRSIRFSEAERKIISSRDPVTRIHYTAPKTGTLRMYWDLPGARQVIVEVKGSLLLTRGSRRAEWKVKVVDGRRLEGAEDPADYGVKETP